MDPNQLMPTPQNPTPPGFYNIPGVSPMNNVMGGIDSIQQTPSNKTARAVGASLAGGATKPGSLRGLSPDVFKSHVTKLMNNLHGLGIPFAGNIIDALHEIDPVQAEQKWAAVHAAMDKMKQGLPQSSFGTYSQDGISSMGGAIGNQQQGGLGGTVGYDQSTGPFANGWMGKQ